MKNVSLFIGVGLNEGVNPKDFNFIVESSECIGVDVLRDADDGMTNFLIDSDYTFILGKEENNINMNNHDLIIELKIAVDDEINQDELSFEIYDHDFEDGFTVAITNATNDEDIVFPHESYIIRRLKG